MKFLCGKLELVVTDSDILFAKGLEEKDIQ